MGRVYLTLAVLLLSAAVGVRFLWLDRLPGISGDEAYISNQVERFVRGTPYTFRTPTGPFISPFIILPQAVLVALKSGPATGWTLRLPVALWNCLAIGVALVLYQRVYGRWRESLAFALLLATMPLSIAYSRLAWDTGHTVLVSLLLLYVSQRLAERHFGVGTVLLFGVCSLLFLWVHLVHVFFVAMVTAALVWVRREELLDLLARRLQLGRRQAVWVGIAVLLLLALFAACGVFAVAARQNTRQILAVCGRGLLEFLSQPRSVLIYLFFVGDILSGQRAFESLAGLGHMAWLDWLSITVLGLVAWAAWRLRHEARSADRLLAAVWVMVPPFLIVTFPLLHIQNPFDERYVIWLLPLGAMTVVRCAALAVAPGSCMGARVAGGAAICLPAASLLLCWFCLFRPMVDMRYADRLHRALRTSVEGEPKEQAARLIRRLAGDAGQGQVYAEDWWLLHPLRYFLEPQFCVHDGVPEAAAQDPNQPRFLVGFPGSEFTEKCVSAAKDAQARFEQYVISTPRGRPLVVVVYLPAVEAQVRGR